MQSERKDSNSLQQNPTGQRQEKAGSPKWDPKAIEDLALLLNDLRDSETYKLVDTKEIQENGYKLQVGRYLKSKEDFAIKDFLTSRDTVNLGDIAEIKRPLASLGKKSETGISLREATLGDISDSSLISQGSKAIQIPETVIVKGRDQLLVKGDVLLSIKGSIGKLESWASWRNQQCLDEHSAS